MSRQETESKPKFDATPFKKRGIGSCLRWFVGIGASTWLILAGALTVIGFPPTWIRDYTGLTLETTFQLFSFNLLAALIAPILLCAGIVVLMILDIDLF